MRPKYPHLLFSFAFFFSRKFETYCDIFETYWCVSRLNPSLLLFFFLENSRLIVTFSRLIDAFRDLIPVCSRLILFDLHQWWQCRRRRRLTPEIVGSGRLDDVEFIGAIGFVRFATDRRRSDDEGSKTIRVWLRFSLHTARNWKWILPLQSVAHDGRFAGGFVHQLAGRRWHLHWSSINGGLGKKKKKEDEGQKREKKRSWGVFLSKFHFWCY